MGMLIPSIGDRCAALQDTSMGTVPGTTPGAGALAPAPEVLTIDTQGLRDFIAAERRLDAAVVYMRKLFRKSKSGTADDAAINTALVAVLVKWEDTIFEIRRRGGLLHIGAGV